VVTLGRTSGHADRSLIERAAIVCALPREEKFARRAAMTRVTSETLMFCLGVVVGAACVLIAIVIFAIVSG
jgi:hypothetical protein